MEFDVTLKANDGRIVKMAAHQANAIQQLNNTRKAGIASVVGYQPTTNWEIVPVQDIQLITHISIENLYRRRLEALQEVELADVAPFLPGAPAALSNKSIIECLDIFNDRKAKEIASLEKSLAGERDDAHREAHDTNYAHFGSVKVHLVTEDTMVDGKKRKRPVEDDDGNVELNSIMIPYIELNVTTRQKGKRKDKSGASVLMKNLINRVLNKRSTQLKTLSLKAENFEAFNVDGTQLVAEDVARFGDLLAA